MAGNQVAFMSYAHDDDKQDDGWLTQLHQKLQGEIRTLTGRNDLVIFQDSADIAVGRKWGRDIDESLDAAPVLIVIITPAFLASKQCQREVTRFLERERRLGHDDLILPVYYIDISATQIEDPALKAFHQLTSELATRQHADWCPLRGKQVTNESVRAAITALAKRIIDYLPSSQAPAPPTSHPSHDNHQGRAHAQHTSRRDPPPPSFPAPSGMQPAPPVPRIHADRQPSSPLGAVQAPEKPPARRHRAEHRPDALVISDDRRRNLVFSAPQTPATKPGLHDGLHITVIPAGRAAEPPNHHAGATAPASP
jgi:TIR domain